MPVLKPKIRDEVAFVEVGDEIVLWNPNATSGTLHFLNPPAALVFRLCDGTGTPAELAADIAGAYGQPVDEVEKQVRGMVRIFRRRGLLTVKPVARRAEQSAEHDHGHDHHHDHDHDHDHAHDHDQGGEAGDQRERVWREVPDNE